MSSWTATTPPPSIGRSRMLTTRPSPSKISSVEGCRFAIRATTAGDVPGKQSVLGPVLQDLLERRTGLDGRWQPVNFPVLVVDRENLRRGVKHDDALRHAVDRCGELPLGGAGFVAQLVASSHRAIAL